jgi:hypothetical protein
MIRSPFRPKSATNNGWGRTITGSGMTTRFTLKSTTNQGAKTAGSEPDQAVLYGRQNDHLFGHLYGAEKRRSFEESEPLFC